MLLSPIFNYIADFEKRVSACESRSAIEVPKQRRTKMQRTTQLNWTENCGEKLQIAS